MGKANWFYDSKDRRWKLRGAAGETIAEFDDTSSKFPKGIVVAEGTEFTKLVKITGTLTGIAAIGSAAVAIGTVTGVTDVAVGDLIHVMPKAALAGHIGFVGAYVPTTNTVNIYVGNTKPDSAGSLPSVGVDLLQIRLG